MNISRAESKGPEHFDLVSRRQFELRNPHPSDGIRLPGMPTLSFLMELEHDSNWRYGCSVQFDPGAHSKQILQSDAPPASSSADGAGHGRKPDLAR